MIIDIGKREASKTSFEQWKAGAAPVSVIMISLNEAHNIEAVLDNLEGWAQEVFLVDSYSSDETVDIALKRGVHVVQRKFAGFGDQWNFAVSKLPTNAPWSMKLDPDERLTEELKSSIIDEIERNRSDAIIVQRRLWFMGTAMPVRQKILRVWRSGICRFTDVSVNEHPLVVGKEVLVNGVLEHHDSPNLYHWCEKQNRYTSAEAIAAFTGQQLACEPKLMGTSLQRRMWLKSIYSRIPFRHQFMFFYCYIWLGAWRCGRIGYIWSHLRSEVFRMREYKRIEMNRTGIVHKVPRPVTGTVDTRVEQH